VPKWRQRCDVHSSDQLLSIHICLVDDLRVNIAIIPARGGSKRIPRKNIKDFCGKPVIAYSIEAAQSSKVIDKVIVSTDDDEIADVVRKYGAEVPFRRPAMLSNDHAGTTPVIAHAIRWFEENRGPLGLVCCIYATAPLLQPRFLRKGLEILQAHPDADFAFGVTSYPAPILRSLKRNPDGTVSMNWPEHEGTRSQDLPEALHDAGQFYWGRPRSFFKSKGTFSARSYPVLLPRYLVQDIDTPEDWEMAESIYRASRR
jgi:pseudaminic acid cytidylyltransferase